MNAAARACARDAVQERTRPDYRAYTREWLAQRAKHNRKERTVGGELKIGAEVNQTTRVLHLLRDRGERGITARELERLGISRPGYHVARLQAQGVRIAQGRERIGHYFAGYHWRLVEDRHPQQQLGGGVEGC